MDSVTTSEGVFARSVRVVYIPRHDDGGEESVMAKGVCFAHGSEERRGSGRTRGQCFVLDKRIVNVCVKGLLC